MGNTPSQTSRSSNNPNANSSSSSGPSASSLLPGSRSNRNRSGSTSTFLQNTFGTGNGNNNSSSSSSTSANRQPDDPLVDGGHTFPLGLYQAGSDDFSKPVVRQLIQDRKLAPFYPGLEDHEEDWDEAEIVGAMREARAAVETKIKQKAAGDDAPPVETCKPAEGPTTALEKKEAAWFGEAAECPLCFLYYPTNINTSRCCDQPICTECFVQIKRADATITHLESEPACCPYCMEPNFGIVYMPPKPRLEPAPSSSAFSANDSGLDISDIRKPGETKRRKSVNHTAVEVVTIDMIRPDWEAKLAAVKALASRRANRRIVMRQVGDRLIPVGITSSRDPLAPLQLGDDTGRRGSRGRASGDLSQLLAGMGLSTSAAGGGQDIEDLMMMEAMRLSLLEEEQRQARANAAAAAGGTNPSDPSSNTSTDSSSPSNPPSTRT